MSSTNLQYKMQRYIDEYNQEPVSDGKACRRIWFSTWLVINIGAFVAYMFITDTDWLPAFFIFAFASFFCSCPALLILFLTTWMIEKLRTDYESKLLRLHLLLILIAILYALIPGGLVYSDRKDFYTNALVPASIAGILYAASFIAVLLNRGLMRRYLGYYGRLNINASTNSNIQTMQQNPDYVSSGESYSSGTFSNKVLIKSLIMAALVLLMLIPTTLIQGLITERQQRQQQVVDEVSSKWAMPQTLSAPYLVIPYTYSKDKGRHNLVVLPDQLNVKGNITEESRPRSIYKVLLYKSNLNFSGSFHPTLNLDDSDVLLLNEAKVCFGLSDFKGIEDNLSVTINGSNYSLLAGLPANAIDSTGLSAPVNITAADLAKGISFNMQLPIKGSGYLHFLPISSSSKFHIESSWPAPSFDGNALPAEREVSGKGFAADWKFIAANLPFTSTIKNGNINTTNLAFGVSLVQPADQYVQSMRSAKYAILIIGLTFAVFFIFELFQKKPVHPVQYILIGFALVLFYTLLLSISEIIVFGYAYAIAATATVLLIALYAKSHFKTTRSAFTFGGLLAVLYGFIYVLISLEDTALLVSSITLFIAVAITMYITRKINWYQPSPTPAFNVQP